MRRLIVVRWLLGALLGSFVISMILSPPKWVPLPKNSLDDLGFQGLYFLIVIATAISNIVAYFLVTPPKIRKNEEEDKSSGDYVDIFSNKT